MIDDTADDRLLSARVPAGKTGERLDKFLSEAFEELSRSRLKGLIEAGRVAGPAGPVTEAKRKVRAGEDYAIGLPAERPGVPAAQDVDFGIIYEDEHLIVIDKPAGLVVHPAPGNPDRTLVNGLLAHCGPSFREVGGAARPGIVHRLDKGTSGVMVAAKTPLAYRKLTEAFASHDIERAYEAAVWGIPGPARGTIAGNIGRSPNNRKKMAVLRRGGKRAVTRYQVLARAGSGAASAALVGCELETGRTHQIRVHMAHLGHPIIGDPLYGRARKKEAMTAAAKAAVAVLDRPLLHAVYLGIRHPSSGKMFEFKSEKPQFFNGIINSFDES